MNEQMPGEVRSNDGLGVRRDALLDLVEDLEAGYSEQDGGADALPTQKERDAAVMLRSLDARIEWLHNEFRRLHATDSSAGYKKWDAARMKVDDVLTLTTDSWGERDLVSGGTHGS